MTISWSDATVSQLSSDLLRRNCPCASCRELRGDSTHAKPLSTAPSTGRGLLKVIKSTATEESNLLKISAIGNYAVGIVWADGHDSGIFTYEQLQELGSNA